MGTRAGSCFELGAGMKKEMGTARMICPDLMRAEGDVVAGCA